MRDAFRKLGEDGQRESGLGREKILSGRHVRVIKHKSYDAQQKRIK